MIVLDTDTLTLFFRDHARVVERFRNATAEIATTVISRIEILKGRFDSLLKAADGAELQRGQRRIVEAERDLVRIPKILLIDSSASVVFDRLHENKKLKK